MLEWSHLKAACHALRPAHLLADAFGFSKLQGQLALAVLRRNGDVAGGQEGYRLTEQGYDKAAGLVRTHRLWEAYLERVMNLKPDHVHQAAHRLEHLSRPQLQTELAKATDDPETDPHGKPIPTSRR